MKLVWTALLTTVMVVATLAVLVRLPFTSSIISAAMFPPRKTA